MKRSKTFAWVLCGLCIVAATVNFVLWYTTQPQPPGVLRIVGQIGWLWLLPVVYSAIAALIIARQPDNRVGWLLMLPAFASVISVEAYLATPRTEVTPGLWLMLLYDKWAWIPVIFPIFLIPLHFPDGHPPSGKWNWVNWLALGLVVFFSLASPFWGATIGPMNYDWRLPNPIGLVPDAVVNGPILIGWGIGLITVAVASVTSLILRYRRSGNRTRQQIKWLLLAGLFFIPIYAAVGFLTDPEETGFGGVWEALLLLAPILGFAVAIAMAILRYQLYDIDVIIRKTLTYSILTALLGLVYFGSVVALQIMASRTLGEQSSLTIVVSTLLIAALFVPLRNRIQAFIDRRFFRRKYDAQRALADFGQITREQVDLNEITSALTAVVEQTIQPESVTLWLKEQTHGSGQAPV